MTEQTESGSRVLDETGSPRAYLQEEPTTTASQGVRQVPNQPKTPARPIRIPDGIWVSALEIAARRGETASAVVRADLTRYVRRHWRLLSSDTRAWIKTEFPALYDELTGKGDET